MIESLAWVLPRPRRSKYKGGFPLHFEIKLIRELNLDPEKHKILHPFGGHAEHGIRVDINPDVKPDVVGDAHSMHMFKNNEFDLVILDPPYTDEYSKELYGTGKLSFKKYTTEAVRVTKPGSYIAMYHFLATPRLDGTKLVMRIFLETRIWHKLRCIHIYQKEEK